MGLYTSIVRPLAFRLEAERAHHLAIKLGGGVAWAAKAVRPLLDASDARLETRVAGLTFPNPIGLAAGYARLDTIYVNAQASRIGQIFDSFEPRHTWRLWGVHRFGTETGSRWSVGLGLNGQSRLPAVAAPTELRVQGGFTLANARRLLTSVLTAAAIAVTHRDKRQFMTRRGQARASAAGQDLDVVRVCVNGEDSHVSLKL